jgi:hypothetical protein
MVMGEGFMDLRVKIYFGIYSNCLDKQPSVLSGTWHLS